MVNIMKKYTQKELKRLISTGFAIDITHAEEIPANLEKIGYCTGVYGIAGGLLQDHNGQLYAITKRTSNLLRIF